MKKRVLSVVLALMLCVSMIPLSAFAQDTADIAVLSEFEEFLKNSAAVESVTLPEAVQANYKDSIDLPVHINTYIKGETNADTAVVLYIMNHGMERVGQEDDISIITDLLDEGYIVVTLDYLNNPKAVSPEVDWSIQTIKKSINDKGTYLAGAAHLKDATYAVPAGNRIVRNIKFFGLDEHASKGTIEKIVEVWNTSSEFKAKCASKGFEWHEAETIDDCTKPDGSPLDMDLRMDIIYPSQPKEAPPVFMLASSSETRNGSTLTDVRPHHTGFLMRGYATVCYDHEYIPMARNDHFGYFNPYGLASWNGVKSHTAAARKVRDLAYTYGYDEERISVWGHSKSSYSALLARENPEQLSELATFSGFPDETYGEQPWLTYSDGPKAGQPIPSNVQCCYSSMGDGTKNAGKLVNETTAPTIIACGYYDEFGAWDYWPALQQTYMDWDVPSLAIGMMDLGHAYPYGIDPDLHYDRYAACLDFFDYYLKPGTPPKLVYTTPEDQTKKFSFTDKVTLKFNAPIALSAINEGVKVIETGTGRAVAGVWTPCLGNTEWSWQSYDIIDGKVYNVVVTTEVKDAVGQSIPEGALIRFQAGTGTVSDAIADAYINSAYPTQNFGSANEMELDANTSGSKKGYLQFAAGDFSKSTMAELQFMTKEDASQIVAAYGLSADSTWDESSISWENAPAPQVEKLGSAAIGAAGIYKIDVTDYIDNIGDAAPAFVLTAQSENGGAVFEQDWDDVTSLVRDSAAVNNCYSDTAHYRQGGDPVGIALSDVTHGEEPGHSVLLKQDDGYDRIKFYNTFKDSALDETDIGRTFDVSFWAKGSAVGDLQAGIMAATGVKGTVSENLSQNFYNGSWNFPIGPDEWTQCSFRYTLDANNCDPQGQMGMLTIQSVSAISEIYIDDITVTEVATPVSIYTRESADASSGIIAPKLVIYEGEDRDLPASDAAVVAGGIRADSVLDASAALLVDGQEVDKVLDGVKKGYIKFALEAVAADANSAIDLSFEVTNSAKQTLHVYGVDIGEENLNTVSGGNVHLWDEKTLTWENATANDRLGYGVNTSAAMDLGTVSIDGAGTYTVDVKGYIEKLKAQGADYATIVLTAEKNPNAVSVYYTYDDKTELIGNDATEYGHSAGTDFVTGGALGTSRVSLSNEMNYPSGAGKSIQVTNFTNQYARLKLYNLISKKNALTQDDLGRKIKVSMYVYPVDKDTKMSVKLMGDAYSPKGTGQQSIQTTWPELPANTWTKIEQVFEITQAAINGDYAVFAIESSTSGTGAKTIYIDNVAAADVQEDVAIASKDSARVVYYNSFDSAANCVRDARNPIPDGAATSFSADYTYREGYEPRVSGFSANADYNGNGGGSFQLGLKPVASTGARAKFYNIVEPTRNVTADDKGRTFTVTYFIRGDVSSQSVNQGLMGTTAYTKSQKNPEKITVTPNWQKYSYTFTIDDDMINNQAVMFSFTMNGDGTARTIYVDDLKVVEQVDSGADRAAKLKLTPADGGESLEVLAAADTFVQSGTSFRTNFNGDDLLISAGNLNAVPLDGVEKTYIKFQGGNYAASETCTLKFDVLEATNQTVQVYGVDGGNWSGDSITWSSAPGNDIAGLGTSGAVYIGSVDVTNPGQYTLDASSFAKGCTSSDITFILTAKNPVAKKLRDWSFDGAFGALVENADYRKTGAYTGGLSIVDDPADTANKVLKFADFNYAYARPKMMKAFDTAPFTAADKGRTFKVSFRAYPSSSAYAGERATNPTTAESIKLTAGFYSNYYGGAGNAGSIILSGAGIAEQTVPTDTWTSFSFDFEVTDAMIGNKVTAFGICQNNSAAYSKDIYLDDLVIEEVTPDAAQTVKIAPVGSENGPRIFVKQPVLAPVDPDSHSLVMKDAVSSSGAFMAGDTVILRAEGKASLDLDVTSIGFYYSDGTPVDGTIYRDGYDYCLRMFDVKAGAYSIYAAAAYSNSQADQTNPVEFSVSSKNAFDMVSLKAEGTLAAGEAYTVNAVVRNNTASDKPGVFIVGIYDASGNLVDAAISTPATLSAGEDTSVSASFAVLEADVTADCQVRAYLWNNTEDVIPYMKAQIVK